MTTMNTAKLTARLARTEALRTARAELRCELAAKMNRSPFDRQVIREANAQLRNAGWRV